MPFNYQTLKNLTGASIIDLSIPNADIATRSIPTGQLNTDAITSAKFSTGAVNLTATTVTGIMPISKGGTNLSTVGAANTVLRVNAAGNAYEYAVAGFSGMQIFSSTGTWNRPTGVRYIRVKVQGAGGGASGHGESGAAGGYAERIMDVTSIASVSITVATGGGGVIYAGPGGNASGATSFGTFVSASGGHGANRQNQHSGGVSGVGSGGDLNLHQGGGGSHHDSFGPGGGSYWGGAAPSGHPQGGNFAHNHQGHSSPGSGGTGGHFHGHRGSDGRPGLVVIEEYK